jgi:hypothetical protein
MSAPGSAMRRYVWHVGVLSVALVLFLACSGRSKLPHDEITALRAGAVFLAILWAATSYPDDEDNDPQGPEATGGVA